MKFDLVMYSKFQYFSIICLEIHWKSSLKILEVSKLITEKLEIYQQICLVNLMQINWWKKTKNVDVVKKLEKLKFYITKNIQPRLAWEITLLKISIKDF